MSNNCVRFFEEPSTNPGSFTPEFSHHILTCLECQKNLKAIQNLRSHIKPLTGTELSEIGTIVAAASLTAGASASASAGKIIKTSISSTKIAIIVLVSTITMVFVGLNHSSLNMSKPSEKPQNSGISEAEQSQLTKMEQKGTLVYKPKVSIAQMKHIRNIFNERHLAFQKSPSVNNKESKNVATKVLALAQKAFTADNAYFSALLNSKTPPAKTEALKLERKKAVDAFEKILKEYPEFALNNQKVLLQNPDNANGEAPEAELSKIGEAEDSFKKLEAE